MPIARWSQPKSNSQAYLLLIFPSPNQLILRFQILLHMIRNRGAC